MGLWGLVAFLYFEVAGTPAGCENAVVAAGPLIALVSFAAVPLVWSAPEALMTAELSVMFPRDAGFVEWVAAGVGTDAAFVVGGLAFIQTYLDASIYPGMMLQYAATGVPWLRAGGHAEMLVLPLSAVLILLNAAGVEGAGRFSLAVMVFTLLPFVAFAVCGFASPELELARHAARRVSGWAPQMHCGPPREGGEAAEGVGGHGSFPWSATLLPASG